MFGMRWRGDRRGVGGTVTLEEQGAASLEEQGGGSWKFEWIDLILDPHTAIPKDMEV
jgi:hypothetical protein